MPRSSLLLVLLVACATAGSGQDAACRNTAGDMTQTRIENALAMMDAVCVGDPIPSRPSWPVQPAMCVEMGDALVTGRCGMPRDLARAKRYYEGACAKSYQPACSAMARLPTS